MTLAAIERYLEQLPPGPQRARPGDPPRRWWPPGRPDAAEEVTREELERRAGRALTEEDLDRLAAMGVARSAARTRTASAWTPGCCGSACELLDVPIAQETILAARTVLLEHTRAAAQELSRLFRDEVWGRTGSGESGPAQWRDEVAVGPHAADGGAGPGDRLPAVAEGGAAGVAQGALTAGPAAARAEGSRGSGARPGRGGRSGPRPGRLPRGPGAGVARDAWPRPTR